MALSIRLLSKEPRESGEKAETVPSRTRLGLLFGAGALRLRMVKIYITDRRGVRREIRRSRSDDEIWEEYKRGTFRDLHRQIMQRARLNAWMESRTIAGLLRPSDAQAHVEEDPFAAEGGD